MFYMKHDDDDDGENGYDGGGRWVGEWVKQVVI